ncbi:MAG: HD-GYP domain-containing protein [Proteobacteria bacterium]|nr:HD-GYP domain-containing protein [Pseudomonadota bacterium]
MVENANEAILIAQDGLLKYVNPMTLKILGYSEDFLTSTPFMEIIHPDDRERLFEAHIRRMRGEETQPVTQFRAIARDGTFKLADSHAVIISWEGKPATLNYITDITERKQAEEQLKHTLESLRKAFGTTVQVMVSAVETRDPYTSGHQLRVANIARAIATELGLSQDQIEGLRMAGSIHDIGKLSVPAEILSKPGKLSDLEFSLIKEHAQKGYEMLKDVESPWPLAEIVYQHHERMDGSGYPRKLKKDEIIMEARIMAVADVVESMASYRPYRPALGINAAFEEIEKNKETLYDADVVDACLRLFREKGFQLG